MSKIVMDVKNVSTSYKQFSVEKINFHLESGDILGLVGRSGSGKSTVIKTLIGEKHKDEGEILASLNEKPLDVNSVLGYSPQDNALFPYLSLEENIFTFGQLNGMDKKTISVQINSILKRLDLLKFKDKRVNKLSGGMRKRADIAVALIHNPKIIILDEPFSGLDISLQKFIWNFLKKLAAEGKIIIISSHMLGDIQSNCNKFGLIYKNQYYNTEQIMKSIKKHRTDLTTYLDGIFTTQLFSEGDLDV